MWRGPGRGRERGEILFGTVDSWLVWKLTGGAVHVTDVHQRLPHHALRHPQAWTGTTPCCSALDIPRAMLPQVRSSSEIYGYTEIQGVKVPIAGHRRRPAGGPVRTDLL